MSKKPTNEPQAEGNPPVDEDGRRYAPRKPKPKPEESAPPAVVADRSKRDPQRLDFPEIRIEPDEADIAPPPLRRRYWVGVLPDAPLDEIRAGCLALRKQTGLAIRNSDNGHWTGWFLLTGGLCRLSADDVEGVLWALSRLGVEETRNGLGELVAAQTVRLRPGLPCAARYVWLQEVADDIEPMSLLNATPPPPVLTPTEPAAAS